MGIVLPNMRALYRELTTWHNGCCNGDVMAGSAGQRTGVCVCVYVLGGGAVRGVPQRRAVGDTGQPTDREEIQQPGRMLGRRELIWAVQGQVGD